MASQGGTNMLRGGKNKYSTKCLEGSWYDQRKQDKESAPPVIATETQIRAAETTGLKVPSFGASLRSTYSHIKSVEDHLDYENIVYPYKKFTERQWVTITATTHFDKHSGLEPGDDVDFTSSYHMCRHELPTDPAALAEYRARWLNEAEPVLRAQRFTSAMSSAFSPSVQPQFRVSCQRFLVGVPKSVEVLRQRTEEALGMDGILRLALILPPKFKRTASSMVNPLREALKAKGVVLSADQGNELWGFLDPLNTLEAHTGDLIRAMLGRPIDPPRLAAIQRAWSNLTTLAATNSTGNTGNVTMKTFASCFDGAAHLDARRKPVPRFGAQEAVARVYEGLAAVVAMRNSTHGDGHMVSSADVSDATVLEYESFEDYWAFVAAVVDADEAFVRMLDMGFRIGVPGVTSANQTSSTLQGPLLGGLADAVVVGTATTKNDAGNGGNHGSSSSSSMPTTATLRGALGSTTTAGNNAPFSASARLISTMTNVGPTPSPLVSTRGPAIPGSPGAAGQDNAASRTTYSELGSGLAFATKPYRPRPRNASPSPSRRQSRPPGATDAESAAASAVTNIVVLVTHGSDGSKRMYKLAADRFLDKKDVVGIKARVEAAGIQDVAAVSVDF